MKWVMDGLGNGLSSTGYVCSWWNIHTENSLTASPFTKTVLSLGVEAGLERERVTERVNVDKICVRAVAHLHRGSLNATKRVAGGSKIRTRKEATSGLNKGLASESACVAFFR